MVARKILAVGLQLAHPEVQTANFASRTSLLDWDIVLFKPSIQEFIPDYSERYQGKPCLNENASFRVKESCEHWRREIKQAVGSQKTVVIFLPELEQMYVDTGQRTHSGTGRN